MNTVLTNYTDELPVVMKNYTKSFVDYALAQAYHLDFKSAQGNLFLNSAVAELNDFQKEISPRHKTGPQYIDLVAPLGAEDDSEFL
jgi:hypothetical protein